MITKKQLQDYIERNSNIDFNYNSKRYGIERREQEGTIPRIYFWEWYNESTFDNSFSDFTDFETNAMIDGKPVVAILEDIEDIDVFQKIKSPENHKKMFQNPTSKYLYSQILVLLYNYLLTQKAVF